jgi:amino acid permease
MPRPSYAALLQTSAFCVATILGSGILGLPVSLYRSGIPPFILSFTCTLVAQLSVVYAGCEILQRAQVDIHDKVTSAGAWESLQYGMGEIDRSTNLEAQGEGQSGLDSEPQGPSLHTFAELYLPSVSLKVLFETAVMLHFISIMSSYALGAPQAFEAVFPDLFHVSHLSMIIGFSVISSLIVVFFSDAIVLPLTIATFFKGGLLSGLVIWILVIGIRINVKPLTDWSPAADIEPFLMGSLALAGCINLMPKLWEICLRSTGLPNLQGMDREFVSWFRAAVNVAVLLCYVLNILWCIGVLLIVPQTSAMARSLPMPPPSRSALLVLLGTPSRAGADANSSGGIQAFSNLTSLAHSNSLGEISTIPLVEVLKSRSHGGAQVIFNLVNLFVFVSITVSFLVVGIGMKHMLDDLASSAVEWIHFRPSAASPTVRQVRRQKSVLRHASSLLSFGVVAGIAASNPRLLLKIMAGVTSLCVNAEGGLLIMVMLYVSRKKHRDEANLKAIPAAMSPVVSFLVLFVGFSYYGFVILLDISKYLPTLFS